MPCASWLTKIEVHSYIHKYFSKPSDILQFTMKVNAGNAKIFSSNKTWEIMLLFHLIGYRQYH